jgi:Rrf2 family protein
MFVTREADYAVRCILYLAQEAGRTISAAEISKSTSIPRSFMAKILQRLSKKDIVRSVQGITGGFQLAREPGEINLLEVIEAIQGPVATNLCAVDNQLCDNSGTCAVHPVWVKLKETTEEQLREVTFAKLMREHR